MISLYTMVGMKWRGTERLVGDLKRGEVLELRRDPNNQHDFNAVQVWYDGQHVAFIKGTEVAPLAREMDALDIKTTNGKFAIGGDRWPQVEVELTRR